MNEKPEPVAWQCREHGDDEWFDCSKEAYGINPSRYVYRRLYTAPPEDEALRRDAERYRWLRGEHSRIDPCIKANAKYRLERDSSTWVNIHDLDAAIDAAMGDKT